jgi:hypothetical protein
MIKLTNLDIFKDHQDTKFYFMRSDFLSSFAYWTVLQSPYEAPDITKALKAFGKYVSNKIEKGSVQEFNQSELNAFVNDKVFESIPDIKILNQPAEDDDFIDLSALARNITHMMMREQITQI